MSAPGGIVHLPDDEPALIPALTRLLRAKQFEVRAFTSVRAFVDACRAEDTACLVLEVAMPELDGLELQRRLARHGILIPIVFLTRHSDIPMSVRAIKANRSRAHGIKHLSGSPWKSNHERAAGPLG